MSPRLSSSLAVAGLFFWTTSFLVAPRALTVAAAADLAAVQPDLTLAFQKANPGIEVRFVTEASAVLSQQIENGAPYDVFMSANAQFADRLAASGKLKTPSVYATGRVAVLWRDGKRHGIKDLSQNWVHYVALANPKLAPYGAAAREALEHAGIWQRVEAKVVYGENVRQTLQLFDSGNADAVLTAAGLVADRNPQLIPDDWHKPIIQKAGIVSASPKQRDAALFMTFLSGAAAQGVFARHGFGKPAH